MSVEASIFNHACNYPLMVRYMPFEKMRVVYLDATIGDLNGDGTIDIQDITCMHQIFNSSERIFYSMIRFQH